MAGTTRTLLTRAILDRQRCMAPGCTHEDHRLLYLSPGCHPADGVTVAYDMVRGSLVARCLECEALVAEIAVAAQ